MIKTIFCDIDGCLTPHTGSMSASLLVDEDIQLLPGTMQKFDEWNKKGYYIVLTTGRKESMRSFTERQLSSLGIFWDQLILGLPRGQRVVINDLKPDYNEPTALAINLERNKGISEIEI